MKLTNSVLKDVRLGVGLLEDTSDFDTDLLMNINAAIGELNQNGVGKEVIITDETTTWGDLQNPAHDDRKDAFKMVPLYVTLSTKLIFDPPPPSAVEHHRATLDKYLWRLRTAFDEPNTTENGG